MFSFSGAALEEKVVESVTVCLEDGLSQQATKVGIKRELHDHSMKPSLSNNEDSSNCKQEDVLVSTKAEMGEVKEENQRLKTMLEQIDKDYRTLQLRFFDILQQESSKNSTSSAPSHDETEAPELVSLCLGRSPSTEPRKDDKPGSSSKTKENEDLKASLTLGFDSNFLMNSELVSNPSPEDSLEEQKEEEAGETWTPSKIPKRNGDDDVAQQSHVKRARVCVRARCDTPTMNDGCQWRKYGQKIAKGNPCPRAYYRCTVAPACPVRKQVQRCAEDMSILITTYEGTHNHPLPVSATAMASTTSAAASMLLSGSSASQPGLGSHVTATSSTELNGLSFSLYDNLGTKQFYFPNSSSQMFPTITLDLTTSSPPTSSTPFSRLPSIFNSTSRIPSTSLSFSSAESNTLPTFWGNNGYQNYKTLPYNHQQLYQPYMEKNNNQATTTQQALTETLTKAITSDPSFRTVIATAISSMIGGNASAANHAKQREGESFGHNLKIGESSQSISANSLGQNAKGCASSFFNGLLSSTPQSGSQLQPALPFSIFNSGPMPTNNKEQKS